MTTDIRPKSKVIKSKLGVFGFDASQLKVLEKQLATIPIKLRGNPIYSAQRTALNITKKQAVNNTAKMQRTGELGKAIQVVRGRDKSFDPYTVLRINPDASYTLPPPPYMDRGKPQIQRPIKYAHLVAGGTEGGDRTGRVRMRDQKQFVFTVSNDKGQPFRILKIKHPGTPANNFIEDAWDATKARAEQKFRDEIIPKIEQFKSRQGFR